MFLSNGRIIQAAILGLTLTVGPFAFADEPCNEILKAKTASVVVPESLRDRLLRIADLDIWFQRDFSSHVGHSTPEILTATQPAFDLMVELGVPAEEISRIATARVQLHLDMMERMSPNRSRLGDSSASFETKNFPTTWTKKWQIDEIYSKMIGRSDQVYTSGDYSLGDAFEIAAKYIVDPENKMAKTLAVYLARKSPHQLIDSAAAVGADEYLMWASKYCLAKDLFETPGSNYLYWAIEGFQQLKDPAMKTEAQEILEDLGDHLNVKIGKDYRDYDNTLKAYLATGDLVDYFQDGGSHKNFLYHVREPRMIAKIKKVVLDLVKDQTVNLRAVSFLEPAVYALRDQKFAEQIADRLGKVKEPRIGNRLLMYATAGATKKFKALLGDGVSNRDNPQVLSADYHLSKWVLPALKRIGDQERYEQLIQVYRGLVNADYFVREYGTSDHWQNQKPYFYDNPRGSGSRMPIGRRLQYLGKHEWYRKYSAKQLIEKGDAELKTAYVDTRFHYAAHAFDYYIMAVMKMTRGEEAMIEAKPFQTPKNALPSRKRLLE